MLSGPKLVQSCSVYKERKKEGYEYKEINRRLSIGRMAMTKLEKIMKDRDVKKVPRIKIAESIIFPTVTYRS